MKFLKNSPLTAQFLTQIFPNTSTQNLKLIDTAGSLINGKLTLQNFTSNKVHTLFIVGESLRTFYRNIHNLSDNMNQGMFSYFQNLQNIQTFRMKRTGFISIDEHISSHCSDNIEGVSYFYSTSHKKPILGQSMISAHYYGNKIEYPVDFLFYRRKEELQKYGLEHFHKKKNELFREIVGNFLTLNNCPDTILMDSYFMTKENARFLISHDKRFVSRLKRNWKGTYNHQSRSMSDLCQSIPLSDFHLTRVKNSKTKKVHGYYTAVRNVFFSGIGTLRVVFVDASRFISSDGTLITNDRYLLDNSMESVSSSEAVTHFHIFVTNQLFDSAEEILNAYTIRWTIETGYRTLNQEFGLEKCQFQSVALQYCFIGLTFLSYWFLLWLQIHNMPGYRGRISTCFSKIKAAYSDYLIDCYEKSRTSMQDLAIKEPYAHALYTRYYISKFSEGFCTLEGEV